jgi:hypothetical protein
VGVLIILLPSVCPFHFVFATPPKPFGGFWWNLVQRTHCVNVHTMRETLFIFYQGVMAPGLGIFFEKYIEVMLKIIFSQFTSFFKCCTWMTVNFHGRECFTFLAHLSCWLTLKLVFMIAHCLSINFTFSTFSPEAYRPILTTPCLKKSGREGIQVCLKKGRHHSPRDQVSAKEW